MAIEPRKTPHPLFGLADIIEQQRQSGQEVPQPVNTPAGIGVSPRFTEPNQPLETPPAGQMQRPALAPNFTGTQNGFHGMEPQVASPMAQGINAPIPQNQFQGQGVTPRTTPQFTMDAGTPELAQPTIPVGQALPNTRPKLVNTGDPLGDAERYEAQARAYKPENHNSGLKSALITGLRGFSDTYNRTGSLAAAAGGGLAGLGAGAVDSSQDEYYHNEHIAKPQSTAMVDRALDVEKTKAGIDHSRNEDALGRSKLEQTQRTARTRGLQQQLAMILRRNQSFDPVNNPEHKRLAEALEAENIPVPDLKAGVKSARLIHDDITGEDSWEITDGDGAVRRTTSGGSHTSASTANRAAADVRQKRQLEAREAARVASEAFDKSEREARAQDALRLKQTPGAPTPRAAEPLDPKIAGKPINMDAVFKEAETTTVPAGPNEDDEDYNRRLQANVSRIITALKKKGAVYVSNPTAVGAPALQGK